MMQASDDIQLQETRSTLLQRRGISWPLQWPGVSSRMMHMERDKDHVHKLSLKNVGDDQSIQSNIVVHAMNFCKIRFL